MSQNENYSDLNSFEFGGRIAFPPESRTTAGGKTMVTTKIPVAEKYNGKEKTLWVKVVAFGAVAEQVMQFQKGDKVKVRGRVSLNEWTNKNGEKRVDLECMVWEMVTANEQFAPRAARESAPRSEPQRQERPRQEEQRRPEPAGGGGDFNENYAGDDDIPFISNAPPSWDRLMR